MSHKEIICDTCIWYDIANGIKSIEQLNDVQLIGTYINVTEISSTPKLYRNLSLVIRTVDTMHRYYHRVFIEDPFEYLISLFHSDFKPNTDKVRRLLNKFSSFKDLDVNDIPEKNIIDTEKQIKEMLDADRKVVNKINEDLLVIRENIKRNGGIDNHRKSDFIESRKNYISDLVLDYSREHCVKEYKLDINDKSWDQLEFFLYTWDSFFKELEIGKRKFHINDLGDLFNLVYVQPGFKYWTSERKWNLIFNSNERLKKYNFSV
jgi:hypothetical protein